MFRKNQWANLVLLLLVTVALAGCVVPEALIVQPPTSSSTAPSTTSPAPAPESTSVPFNTHLQTALDYAPATAEMLAFTNWELLKQVAGFPDITSADSMDERWKFVMPIGVQEHAIASNFGVNYFSRHAEAWGWDSTDLLWETSLTTDGPPIFVLRFRDDFDFAPVFARLDERGYSTSDVGGVTLYSHEMDLTADWIRTSEFAILNIAYVEEEKIFVLSSTPDAVTDLLTAIDEGATLAQWPSMQAVATELGDVGAAILSPMGCLLLDVTPQLLRVSPEMYEAIVGDLDKSGISGLYDGFGLGYRPASGEGSGDDADVPLGVLVHHYPIAAQAEADLEPRRLVAETANSLYYNTPYAELFEVVDAEVAPASTGGANLVLELHALNDRSPQLFINMFYSRDMLFSACGG